MVVGFCGLMDSMPQPVDGFAPRQHFAPGLAAVGGLVDAALDRYRSKEWPVAHASTVLPSLGSTRIFAMCSESFSPTFVQFSPPSVDL